MRDRAGCRRGRMRFGARILGEVPGGSLRETGSFSARFRYPAARVRVFRRSLRKAAGCPRSSQVNLSTR